MIHDMKDQRVDQHSGSNEPLQLMRNGSNNWYMVQVTELKEESNCRMKFRDFPFDIQTCEYILTNLRHGENELVFNVTANSSCLNYAQEYNFEIFPYTGIHIQSLKEPNKNPTFGHLETLPFSMVHHTQKHSIIGFEIRLARSYYQYLWTYFLPSVLVVLIAGCSFIIPPSSVPGRMMLCVTLFLMQMDLLQSLEVCKGTKVIFLDTGGPCITRI